MNQFHNYIQIVYHALKYTTHATQCMGQISRLISVYRSAVLYIWRNLRHILTLKWSRPSALPLVVKLGPYGP